ncbi:MAG: protein kinase [Planctomycetales bacterium]
MAKNEIQSFEEYVKVVRASRLVDDRLLEEIVRDLKGFSDENDCYGLARKLQEQELVTFWQNSHLLKGRSKGFFLGGYKLLDFLGSGGMSTVYLAEHLKMRRKVAIKVLLSSQTDRAALPRFRQECRAVAALDHPNIIRAHDFDTDGSFHYLVMEYVDGPSLDVLAEEIGTFPHATAADYIRQAAEGLQHAHDSHMVHRDIKPSNLLLDPDGVVKILDLGVARVTGPGASLTIASNQNLLGTLDYMAPEQAVDSHGVDGRADVYSLGCTLYFLLAGHPPFPDGQSMQKLLAHQLKQPAPLSQKRPEIPPDLVAAVEQMMANRPGDRFQTMTDVSRGLAPFSVASPIAVPKSKSAAGRAPKRAAAPSAKMASRTSLAPIRLAFWSPSSETGKTRHALCLAQAAADRGGRVLLCDLDPKADLSLALLGDELPAAEEHLKSFLLPTDAFPPPALPTGNNGLFLLPCPPNEESFFTEIEPRPEKLRDSLQLIERYFEWIGLDVPSRFDALKRLGLSACEYLVTPVPLTAEGLAGLENSLQAAAEASQDHPSLTMLGALFLAERPCSDEPKELSPEEQGFQDQALRRLEQADVAPFETIMFRREESADATANAARRSLSLVAEIINRVVASVFYTRRADLPAQQAAGSPEDREAKASRDAALSKEYREQKEWLESLYAQEGEEVLVADFSELNTANAGSLSYCVWNEGLVSLLPRTDLIAFVQEGAPDLHMVNWGKVIKIAGELLDPAKGLSPERFRVERFPSAEQLEIMTR